nr:acyl-CoA dehydratase activase [uncultured Desulfobulbus sp.]
MKYFAGVDAGSTYVKVAVLNQDGELAGYQHHATGIDAAGHAHTMLDSIMEGLGSSTENIQSIMATGYSRRIIDVAQDTVTEIRAHAAGATLTAPTGTAIRTVIDIGGQDSKVIVLGEEGETENFVMNDKCAAGTGRFLESLARVLELEVSELGPLSLESTAPAAINSTCVVFAESEVISLVARKKPRRDIVAGIHESLAKRIGAMARKARCASDILLTGGGGLNPGIVQALEDELMTDIHLPLHPQLNGAIGAARIALNQS